MELSKPTTLLMFILVVGRDGVLALSTSKELRCGNRLVSGLFSRPRLPLGYTYVATVPRGACQVNISETEPSDNYIALKVVNGSSIINGEFAVSAPGLYAAAGSRLVYSRAGGLDVVSVEGPLLVALDIMILYTHAKPNIKYEYMTDASAELPNNDEFPAPRPQAPLPRHHRHHAESHTKSLDIDLESSASEIETNVIGDRKFAWKILSFTPCSRSCGGGLQIGKFKCVEVGGRQREVSPMHCGGSSPAPRRRRCGGAPCPPRWRTTAWAPCPMCGPATRTRLVGCIQDHAKGITKISNQKCPLPMPASSEACNIPNCDGTLTSELSNATRVDARRQVRTQETTDAFKQGPVYLKNASNVSNDLTTTTTEVSAYSYKASHGWLYSQWSECLDTCLGESVQTRSIRCAEPSGCPPDKAPSTSQPCHSVKNCEPQWFTSEWSKCSSKCGGRQVRGVLCLGGNGRRLRDAVCRAAKPALERPCGEDCAATWFLSDWTECRGPCEAGVQTRTVWCSHAGLPGHAGAARDAACASARPLAKRACVPPRCSSAPSADANRKAVRNTDSSTSSSRQTRHHARVSTNIRPDSTPASDCRDKLTNCRLAVQARLCNYPYYAEYCCRSCRGR